MTIWRMRISCRIPKATNTHSLTICNNNYLSPAKRDTRTRLSVTLHLNCLYCNLSLQTFRMTFTLADPQIGVHRDKQENERQVYVDTKGKITYSFRRTLLKNSIVEICSRLSSGTDGFSSHDVLDAAASATFRNSSYCSGREKQAGVMGREKRAGRAYSWLAVLHRPERLQRTLWIPGIRLTRCNSPMSWNSVLEKHSGSPSEKAKHSRRVQFVRRSAKKGWLSKILSNRFAMWIWSGASVMKVSE